MTSVTRRGPWRVLPSSYFLQVRPRPLRAVSRPQHTLPEMLENGAALAVFATRVQLSAQKMCFENSSVVLPSVFKVRKRVLTAVLPSVLGRHV